MTQTRRDDWKELAQKAANEHDSKKLLAIIEELNQALEERENQLRRTTRPTAKPGGQRLLFVDDELSIRLTLPPLLEERGFQVRVASSVPEAIALIRKQEFDVLLCDLNIEREADGFIVVQAVRDANPNCVTILLTGYPAFDTAVRSLRQEVDDYFTKPADLNELVRTIDRKLLARGLQRVIPPKKAATSQSG
jgi:DNA-binding NtrC family response regulator